MASLVKDLVEAGVHFGHRSTHWNPKMEPYIFGKRNKIHIIDVRKTIKGLLQARKFVTRIVSSGKDVLFVGTKRQARNAFETHIGETGMHWVCERWLGGTLTNFRTIRERLKRLVELEALEQTGEINNYSKKMESQLRREKNKILRNLEGIRHMNSLPGAMIVIDVKHEINAVKEARKLGIPTICLIDTDSDPDYADIPIPGNDDAMRSIELVVDQLCRAVMEGKNVRRMAGEGREDDSSQEPQQRRSARAMFRADEPQPTPDESPVGDETTPGLTPASPGPSSDVAPEVRPPTSTLGSPAAVGSQSANQGPALESAPAPPAGSSPVDLQDQGSQS